MKVDINAYNEVVIHSDVSLAHRIVKDIVDLVKSTHKENIKNNNGIYFCASYNVGFKYNYINETIYGGEYMEAERII